MIQKIVHVLDLVRKVWSVAMVGVPALKKTYSIVKTVPAKVLVIVEKPVSLGNVLPVSPVDI